MNTALLERAASHLESIAGKNLEMAAWLTLHRINDEPQIELDKLVLHIEESITENGVHTCGYAGCAIGECSYLPEFQAAGITPRMLHEDMQPWTYIRKVLDIDDNQMSWLFGCEAYPTLDVPASDVAKRIRKLLANPTMDILASDNAEEDEGD